MADTIKKPLSESRVRANKKYLSQFADFKIRITPEERNKIQSHASAKGESMAAFVRRAIKETMERDEHS